MLVPAHATGVVPLGEEHVVVVAPPRRADLVRVPVADLRVLAKATDQVVLVVDPQEVGNLDVVI